MCPELAPAGDCVFMLEGGGRNWYLSSPSFLEKSLNDPCPSGTHYKMSKLLSLSCALDIFQTVASGLYLHGLFVMLSL